jgi:hypothetical protein
MSIDLSGFGHQEVETVTGAKTLDLGDSGVVQNVTATATVTLPAIAVGVVATYTVRVGASGVTATVSPDAGDAIVGNGFTKADDKDLIFTNQPAGSYVTLQAVNEATTNSVWVVTAISGTATREA